MSAQPAPLDSLLKSLEEFSIFGGIERGPVEGVRDLLGEGFHAAGTRIVEEGATGNRLYIVTAGRVQISRHVTPHDRPEFEVILATYGRGATFGEMELIDTQPRSATVTALEPTATVELTGMHLYQIFLREPEVFRMIVLNLARDLSRRLREADSQLALLQAERDG